jgi:hypothetical protein
MMMLQCDTWTRKSTRAYDAENVLVDSVATR